MEIPIEFGRFDKPKTAENVATRMKLAHDRVGLKSKHIFHMSADGGAISSASELEWNTRQGREVETAFESCYAHQNELASKMSTGSSSHVTNNNPVLGGVIAKNHDINERFIRSSGRTKMLRSVQEENKRKPKLPLKQSVVTRWSSNVTETARCNEVMGDLCEANQRLLLGDDASLLRDGNGNAVDRNTLVHSQLDKSILRQLEAGYDPVIRFSKYLQSKGVKSPQMLFEIRHTIQEMESSNFGMYTDISHMGAAAPDGRNRKKTTFVQAPGAPEHPDARNYAHHVDMEQCIQLGRHLYCEDLSARLKLTEKDTGEDKECLADSVTFPALLNPLMGGRKSMVDSGLMTDTQENNARAGILAEIKRLYEKDCAPTAIDFSDNDEDSELEMIGKHTSRAFNKAKDEFDEFEMQCKVKRVLPKIQENKSRVLSGLGSREIRLGQVETPGANLPSGKNLANYVDKKGRFKMVDFFEDHKESFPKLRLLALKRAAGDNVEVNCERFFSLAGYVSHPARSRMKSSTYERLAVLPAIMDVLYIDENAVVDEYIRRRKANDWNEIESEEDEAFLLLEREIAEEEGYESSSDSDDDNDDDS